VNARSRWSPTRAVSAVQDDQQPIGIRIRDLVMPFALKRFATPRAHAWIYTYHVDWQEKVA
jgi:hypothetical protein